MELQGLNDYITWRYDSEGKVITDPDQGGFTYDGDKGKVFDPKTHEELKGLFRVDLASSKGATQANVTGLAQSVQRVYGSNSIAEVNVGSEQPQVALAANDIPYQVSDTLIGLERDKFGGFARKGQPKQSQGGVILHSYNPWKDIDFYFAFPLGLYVPGEMNLQTDNENKNVVHDAMTLNAQARGTDLLLYEKFYSTEEGFDFGQMVKYITGQSLTDSTADNKQATDVHGNPVDSGKSTENKDAQTSGTGTTGSDKSAKLQA